MDGLRGGGLAVVAVLAVVGAYGCGSRSPANAPAEAGTAMSGVPAAPLVTSDPLVRCAGVTPDVAARMQRTLRDPSDRFRGAYPPAPALTCEILRGLDGELADPSVRARYESLASEHWDKHPPLAEVVDSLGRDAQRFTLIALSTHWNTDVKILALRAFQRVPSSLLINTTAANQAVLVQTERAALRFLLVVVEGTPRMIAGSENSTIHGIYMDVLIATLDLLSGERGPGGGPRSNDLTEAQFAEAVASWHRHATP